MSLKQEVTILIADDDLGHARLIEKNLRRAALANRIDRFSDGQEVLDFLFCRLDNKPPAEAAYLLLLDIPKLDGVEVLRQLKENDELRKIPVIMLTTTDDPREVARCHALGCSYYMVKPVDYEKFSEAINSLGHFVTLVEVPEIRSRPPQA
jgi:CheY-like chemotaxis protein